MNRIYKTLWSVATQSWQAVPETARTGGKKSTSSATGVVASVALSWVLTSGAYAQSPPAINQLPTGGTVARGTATINQTATAQAAAMTVNQSSQRAVINWDTFNLGSKASINFVQPNAQAVTLNRVNDSNPSQIFGRMTANGQVFLSNANGVYFSPTSSVDVGALAATTHSISDDNFMSGKYVFERNGATGKVVNEGSINAALGGYVALLAPEVQNAGVVVARAGTVALAAGEAITLNIDGAGGLAGITTTPSAIASLVENKHAVLAPDGQIILSAVGLNKLQMGLIKNSGSLEANSLVNKGGKIYLEGDDITLTSTSKLEAKGATGGGTVLVGGDWQGSGTLRQATKVTMEAGDTIDASATDNGNGGKVVLWSDVHNADSVTRVNGSITAKAGPNGGDGGKVETSGHQVDIAGALVNAGADNGQGGLWLLDPYDYTIGLTEATTIKNSLNLGTSFTVDTASANGSGVTSTGTGTGVINVNSAIDKTTGSSAVTLTLNAADSILIGQQITSSGATTGALSVSMTAGAGSISGSGNLGLKGGTATFNQATAGSYSGVISGTGTTLTKLGAGTLTLSGSSLNTYTGATNINSGTLQIGDGGTTGTLGGGVVSNSGILKFNRSDALTINNAISGTGAVIQAGTGGTTLSGSNSYSGGTTISVGTLLAGNGTALGSGPVSVINDATLDLNGIPMTSIGALTLNSTGTAGGGALINSHASAVGTYAGLVTLEADTKIKGVLKGVVLSNLGTITGAFNLTLDGAGQSVISSVIGTSTGTLTTSGTGSWILKADNTYSGTTTISAGSTLQVGLTSTSGTLGSGPVTNNGVLNFSRSNTYTVSNDISGTGSVTKSGAGTTILTGANSYGASTISAGTLQIGSGGTTGTLGTGAVTDNATLTFNRSDAITVSNAISGTGSVTQAGTGTTTLTGTNSYGATTISAGTLQVGSGGTSGSLGTGAVTDNAALVFNRSDDITFGNTISGTGSFQKLGANTLTSSQTGGSGNTASFTGGTIISGGTLKVDPGVVGTAFTTGNINVSQGATFYLSATSQKILSSLISGPGGITVDTSGTSNYITLSGANTYTGPTYLKHGGLRTGAGVASIVNASGVFISGPFGVNSALTIENAADTGVILQSTTQIGSLSGGGNLGGNFALYGYDLTVGGNNSSSTFSGVILDYGSGGVLKKVGTGTLTLTGTNTYIGLTDIQAGTLRAASNKALGEVSGGVKVANGATLEIGGTTAPGDVAIGAEALTIASGGTVHNVAGANTYAGALTLTAPTAPAQGNYTITIDTGTSLNFTATSGSVVPANSQLTLNLPSGSALTLAKALSGTAGSSSYVQAGTGRLTMPTPTGVTAKIGLFARLLDPTGTDYSTVYGELPDYTFGLFDSASGGSQILSGPTTFSTSGTPTWSGSAPLQGSSAGAYSLTYANGLSVTSSTYGLLGAGSATTWTVTPKTVTFTLTPPSATYNGVTTYETITNATTFTPNGLYGGDRVTSITKTPSVTGVAQAGNFTITPSLAVLSAGASAGNYSFDYASSAVTATVAKANLTLSGSRAYDGTTITAGNLLTATGVNGETFAVTGNGANGNLSTANFQTNATLASAAGLTLGASNGATLGDPNNYNTTLSTAGSSFSVSRTTATLSATKTYSGDTSLTGSQLAITGVTVNGAAETLGYTGTASLFDPNVATTNNYVAGTGLTLTDGTTGLASNYVLPAYSHSANNSATVNRATATVTASKTYNGDTSLASGQVSITGVTVGGVAQVLDFTGTATLSNSHVATSNKYVNTSSMALVDGSTGLASNYDLPASAYSATRNTATVIPLALTVTPGTDISAASTAYGDTQTPGAVSFANKVLGDDVNAVVSVTVPAGSISSAGVAKIGNYYQSASTSLTGAQASDYSFSGLTSSTANYTVSQRALVASGITSAQSVYASALTQGTAQFSNVVAGDSVSAPVTVNTGSTSTSGNFVAGTYTQTAGSTLSGVDAANYSFAGYTSGTNYTIQKLALTGTNVAASSSTYGSTLTPGAVTFGNVVAGDEVNTTAIVNTSALSQSGNAVTGSYTQTTSTVLSGADAANYNLAAAVTSGANYTVSQKSLMLNVPGATRVYDGSNTIHLTGVATINGAISPDDVQIASGNVTGFVDKNVGTNKAVTYTGFALTGNDASNYLLPANPSSNADITPKTLTVTGLSSPASRVYNGTTNATVNGTPALQTAEVVGAGNSTDGKPYSGDVIGFTGTATGSYNSKDVATANTITFGGLASNNTNYNLSLGTQAATITRADLALTGVSAQNKTYDTTLVAQLNGTASVTPLGGDVVTLNTGAASAQFADKNAGTHKPVTASGYAISGADANNYNLLQPTGLSANIHKADLVVSGITAANKVYDATRDASLSGTPTVSALASDAVSVTGTGTGLFVDKNVGLVKPVSVSGYSLVGADADNYNVVQPTGLTADISKAPLTVTAVDAARNFGATNPAFSLAISGYVGGETATTSGVTGVGSATSTATTTTDPGTAAITAGVGTLSATNYAFTRFVDGTLTIGAISALNATEVTALIGSQLANLTGSQVGSFTAAQLQVFSPQQLSTLSPSQLAGLTTEQLLSLSPAQIAAISPAKIASMTPDQFVGLTTSQLQALSAAQVTAISTAQLNQLSSEQIAALTSNPSAPLSFQQVLSLTPAQISAMNPVQVAMLTATQLSALSDAQLQALSATQVSVITADQLGQLTSAQISLLTSNPTATLGFPQILSLTPTQIVGVNPVEVASFTATQIGALSIAQLQALSLLQLASISPENLSSLTPQQIAGLTSNTAAPLSFQQVSALTPAQIAGVDPVRVASLSAVEIGSLSDAQLQALSVLQIAAIAPDHFSALSPAQIMALSITQVINLTPDQLRGLLPEQVASLSAAELAYFDARQLAAIGIVPKAEVPSAIANNNQLPLNFEAAIPVMTEVAVTNAPSTVVATPTPKAVIVQQPVGSAATATQSIQLAPVAVSAQQTGVLAITILNNSEARPTTTGVAFEQDANSVTLRMTAAPVAPPSIEKLAFNDKLTTFLVATAKGEMVEFQGSVVNRRLVIVAPSAAAKQVARSEIDMVLAAAITSLGVENRVMLANLDVVVLDLR